MLNLIFIPSLQEDKLYGRGTTDCLGHVALVTEMFIQLAEKKPKLKKEVWAVFIAWLAPLFYEYSIIVLHPSLLQ